jgi:hypothetical protein
LIGVDDSGGIGRGCDDSDGIGRGCGDSDGIGRGAGRRVLSGSVLSENQGRTEQGYGTDRERGASEPGPPEPDRQSMRRRGEGEQS